MNLGGGGLVCGNRFVVRSGRRGRRGEAGNGKKKEKRTEEELKGRTK